jgi:hypothetical protein
MDERVLEELHPLRLVCLAAANNGGACLSQQLRVPYLVRLRCVGVILKMLECSDDLVTNYIR